MRFIFSLLLSLSSGQLCAASLSYLSKSEADTIEKYTVKAVKYLLMSENNLRTQSYSDAVINLKQSRIFSQKAFENLPVIRLKDKIEVSKESFLAGRDRLFKKSLLPIYQAVDKAMYFKSDQKLAIKKELFIAVSYIGKNDRGEGAVAIDKALSLVTYGKEDLQVINLLRLSNRTMEHLKAREFDSARNVIRSSKFFYLKKEDYENHSSL